MSCTHRRCWWLPILLTVLVLGAVVPAHAWWDKMYKFKNNTGAEQDGVVAILNGMEVITLEYTGSMNPWGQSLQTYEIISTAYSTVMDWNGDPSETAAPDEWVRIGWIAEDRSCRLRDLEWSSGAEIVDITDMSGDGGGGALTYDEVTDTYTLWIINDCDDPVLITYLWCSIFEERLTLEEVAAITDGGIAGGLIAVLQKEVQAAWDQDLLQDPSAKSLLKKLASAAEDNRDAFWALEQGFQEEAWDDWDRARHHMVTFINELETGRKTGKIREELAARWIPMAWEVIAQLGAPSEGTPAPVDQGLALPVVLYPMPGDVYPTYPPDVPPTDPTDPWCFNPDSPWYLTVTITGEQIAQCPDPAVVLHGITMDPDGNGVLLSWGEQAVITTDLQPPTVVGTVTPVTAAAQADGNGWYDTPVTVTLDSPDADTAYLFVAEHSPMLNGTIYPVMHSQGELPWERTYEHGMNIVAFVGADDTGNASEVQTIGVYIDTGPPTISLLSVSPDHLWPPDHTMRPIDLGVVVVDDNPGATWEVLSVVSNQPDNGTGDGDYPNDIQWDDYGQLWLRSERAGPGWAGDDVRMYTVTIRAVDIAGNEATAAVEIPVMHDQGT